MGRPKKTHLGKPSVHKGQERVWWRGRWHDLGPEGSAQARAEYGRLAALWAVSPGAAALPPDEELVGELGLAYLESQDSPQTGTQRDRAILAVELLAERYPTTTTAAFGPRDLRAWQTWLCGLPGLKDPERERFAVTSVNYHVDTIRRVFKWGVSQERVAADKLVALRTVPRPKVGDAREPRIVDPADPAHVRATLPFLRPPTRAMVVLQLAAGARPGELCAMTPAQVHRTGVINVPGAGRHDLDALGAWAYVPLRHKLSWKGKPRVLMFAGEAKEVLAPFLDRPADQPCFSPREAMDSMRSEQRAERVARRGETGGSSKGKKEKPQVTAGDRYDSAAYRHAVSRACRRAKVPHWFPYQLRHLAAAEIQELFGLDAVQALLGHHTKTMAEHYAGLAVKEAARVAKARGGKAD